MVLIIHYLRGRRINIPLHLKLTATIYPLLSSKKLMVVVLKHYEFRIKIFLTKQKVPVFQELKLHHMANHAQETYNYFVLKQLHTLNIV